MLLIHGLDGFHDKPVEKPLGGTTLFVQDSGRFTSQFAFASGH
jgi:hypothetical protein